MVHHFASLVRSSIPEREEGQGLVEYGLILAGVSIAALVALFALGPQISSLFNTVSSSLKSS
jgi:pilus assembly protein Flp/PilA